MHMLLHTPGSVGFIGYGFIEITARSNDEFGLSHRLIGVEALNPRVPAAGMHPAGADGSLTAAASGFLEVEAATHIVFKRSWRVYRHVRYPNIIDRVMRSQGHSITINYGQRLGQEENGLSPMLRRRCGQQVARRDRYRIRNIQFFRWRRSENDEMPLFKCKQNNNYELLLTAI
jgi:hypothetical protein